MDETLQPGLEYEFSYTVPENKTVPHLYPEAELFGEMPNVFATGFLVGLIEWACAEASFGMILRNSKYRGDANLDLVLELANSSRGPDESGRRREFIDLVNAARTIQASREGGSR